MNFLPRFLAFFFLLVCPLAGLAETQAPDALPSDVRLLLAAAEERLAKIDDSEEKDEAIEALLDSVLVPGALLEIPELSALVERLIPQIQNPERIQLFRQSQMKLLFWEQNYEKALPLLEQLDPAALGEESCGTILLLEMRAFLCFKTGQTEKVPALLQEILAEGKKFDEQPHESEEPEFFSLGGEDWKLTLIFLEKLIGKETIAQELLPRMEEDYPFLESELLEVEVLALMEQGKFDEAVRTYSSVMSRKLFQDVEPHLFVNENPEVLESQILQKLFSDENQSHFLKIFFLNQFQHLVRLQDWASAEALAARAPSLRDEWLAVQVHRALEAENRAGAKEFAGQIRDADSKKRAYEEIADALIQQGNVPETLEWLAKFRNERSRRIFFRKLAIRLAELGRLAEAEEVFAKVTDVPPEKLFPVRNSEMDSEDAQLGWLKGNAEALIRMRRFEDARAVIAQMEALRCQRKQSAPHLILDEVELFVQLGDMKSAREVMKIAPKNPWLEQKFRKFLFLRTAQNSGMAAALRELEAQTDSPAVQALILANAVDGVLSQTDLPLSPAACWFLEVMDPFSRDFPTLPAIFF